MNPEYQFLRYNHFGRGLSDRPEGKYDSNFFVKQIDEMLSNLSLKYKELSIIGLSMGTLVSVKYWEFNPNISKIIFIAPVGFKFDYPFALKLLKIPGIGSFLFNKLGDNILLKGLVDDFHKPEKFPEYIEKYKEQLKYKGFKRTILDTIKNFQADKDKELYKKNGESITKVFFVLAEYDKQIPTNTEELIKEAISNADIKTISNASHALNYEKPDELNEYLRHLLKSD